jgi:hypothetical protein
MNNESQSDEAIRYNWERRCTSVDRARLSALYHLKRERFFDAADKLSSAFTAVAATAAVGTLLKGKEAPELAVALLTAFLSLVPLVANPALKARHHGQLASEFRRILADFERVGQRWTEAQCNEFAARLLDLESSEPAPLAALVADCQNQLSLATGQGLVANVRWYHHMLKHWFDLRPDPIPKP